MDIEDIFAKSFLNDLNESEKRKISTSKEERAIAKEKLDKLDVIRQFLQKFVDLGVKVKHCDEYTKNTKTLEGVVDQEFSFHLEDSSKPYSPGTSIVFYHPAIVEIAIPNDQRREGVVVIKVASHHDFGYILESHFTTYESACVALGRFIGRCTTSIAKNPEQYMKDVEKKKQFNNNTNVIASKDNSSNYIESNHNPEETPVLKSSQGKGLKKISEFLHISKSNDDEDD